MERFSLLFFSPLALVRSDAFTECLSKIGKIPAKAFGALMNDYDSYSHL
jgi:hypothetical protein